MADYFVDATLGVDGAAGTELAPWKTLSKVSGVTLSPGDFVYFKRGEVWAEAGVVVPDTGTDGNPITFADYSSGAMPLFNGAILTDTGSLQWTVSASGTNEYYLTDGGGDPGYTEVIRLFLSTDKSELTNGTVGSLADHAWDWGDNDTLGYSTVYFRDDSGDPDVTGVAVYVPQRQHSFQVGTGIDYITVTNFICEMCGGAGDGIAVQGNNFIINDVTSRNQTRTGIAFNGSTIGDSQDNDGAYHGNGNAGVDISSGSNADTVTGFTVDGVSAYDNVVFWGSDGYGIKFTWVDDSTIENCTVYGNAIDGVNLDGDGTNGCDDCTIENNTIYENAHSGVDIEFNSSRNIVRYNLIYDNKSNGSFASGIHIANSQCLDNQIYYNVVNGQDNVTAGGNLIYIGNGNGNSVWNNILIEMASPTNAATNLRGIYLDGSADNTTLKNNIYSGSQNALYIDNGTIPTGLDSDNNDFFSSNASRAIAWSGDGFHNYTLAQWVSAQSQDANSIAADPLFVDEQAAAAGDFSLQSTSPCIDAGVDVSFARDFRGTAVPRGDAPDMGAYEFAVSAVVSGAMINENIEQFIAKPIDKKIGFNATNIVKLIPGAYVDNLLLESGDHFLLEDGSTLILER